MAIPSFNEANLEQVRNVLGDTKIGLTGSNIGRYLRYYRIADPNPEMTKRIQLFDALVARQRRTVSISSGRIARGRLMGKVVTYKNEGRKGMYCQIRLDSGERILVSIAQSGARISKLLLGGLVPAGTIWESNDIPAMVTLFGNKCNPTNLLDSIVIHLKDCRTLDEVRHRLTN